MITGLPSAVPELESSTHLPAMPLICPAFTPAPQAALLGLTRNMAVPCAGTLAPKAPVVVLDVPAHRSLTWYEHPAPPAKPTVAAAVLALTVEPERLRIATARSPLASGRVSTSRVPFWDTT